MTFAGCQSPPSPPGKQDETHTAFREPLDTSPGSRLKQLHLQLSKWSLHYIMSRTEWNELRKRVKAAHPRWHTCSCAERRKATQLHEEWSINRRAHSKRLRSLTYLCPRCHGPTNEGWLPIWWCSWISLETYLDLTVDLSGRVQLSEARLYIDESRERTRHSEQVASLERHRWGLRHVCTGRARLVPYAVNLSLLSRYGHSVREVRRLERRAAALAAEDLRTLTTRLRTGREPLMVYEFGRRSDRRMWGRIAFSLPGSRLYTT